MVRSIHRLLYPTRKGSESPKPIAHASPVVTTAGVRITWVAIERDWTPAELKMLADWAYSLSSQTESLGQQGLVTPDSPYDFRAPKVARDKVDT